MGWTQFATFLIANIVFTLTLWLWNRAESRSDGRHMDNKLDAMRNLVQAIHDEMKDFHYRLVQIEREKK